MAMCRPVPHNCCMHHWSGWKPEASLLTLNSTAIYQNNIPDRTCTLSATDMGKMRAPVPDADEGKIPGRSFFEAARHGNHDKSLQDTFLYRHFSIWAKNDRKGLSVNHRRQHPSPDSIVTSVTHFAESDGLLLV